MTLTPEEKECGRAFRDWCTRTLLNGITADAYCPPFIINYRHQCTPGVRAVQSGTWALKLKQTYILNLECAEHGVPAGKFAFIYRFGECPRGCELRVRSSTGRFVLAASCPPEKGAHIARQHPHGLVPGNQASAAQPS